MTACANLRDRWLIVAAVCLGCFGAVRAARGDESLRIVPQLA